MLLVAIAASRISLETRRPLRRIQNDSMDRYQETEIEGDTMSVRETVLSHIRVIVAENGKPVGDLDDGEALLNSGLDSLGIAILVARLEEALGFDPFTQSDDVIYPVTIGDFIRFYENAAGATVDSRQAG